MGRTPARAGQEKSELRRRRGPGQQRSATSVLITSILHAKRRVVLRTRLAPIIKTRYRNIRVAEPFLDLGDILDYPETISRSRFFRIISAGLFPTDSSQLAKSR